MFFSGATSVTSILFVHDYAAIAAGAALLIATVAHFWSPRKHLFATAFASYILLLIMVVVLLVNTGQASSPFIALWMLAAVFSPVFGWYGLALIGGMTLASLGFSWIEQKEISLGSIGTMLFVSILPASIGVLSLRPGARPEEAEDRTLSELASELSAASNKAEVVISAIADGVIAIDKAGIIQLINPAAQKLIGWNNKDALNLDVHSVLKLVDAKDQPVTESKNPIIQSIQDNRQIHTDTHSLQTADTSKKFLASITISPLGAAGSGSIIVFRDITSEKADEREQTEFISTASHEMRTPVASIEGYLGLALNPRTAQVDDRARDYITKAQESAQHLGRLFQDLLDVTRADDGRLKNEPMVVDIIPFFLDVILGLLPAADEKHLVVNYKPSPNLYQDQTGEVQGDRTLPQVLYAHVDNDHLREVLSNLIENAIKYTPSGTITIDVTGTDDQITISVNDTGIGIPKEDIGHLFQKFYRVDNTSTREIGGTGLGLYLCRRLVEAMGGKIWVESTYQQGSTFFVRLPRLDHVEAKRIIEQSAAEEERRMATEAVVTPINHQLMPTQPTPAVETTDPQPQPEATPPTAIPSMPPHQPVVVPPQPANTERPSFESLIPQTQQTTFSTQEPAVQQGVSLADIERNPSIYTRPATPVVPPRTPVPPHEQR